MAAGNVARGEPRVHLPQSRAQLLARFPYVNILLSQRKGNLFSCFVYLIPQFEFFNWL